jgi:deazaflavin-dependent oxidoreductase (nitroreductase family)
MSYDDAGWFRKLMRRLAASGPGSWIFARTAHLIDRPIYRRTKGKHTFGSLISGLPVVMLTTTGAKTGKPRTVPVLGLATDDGFAVIASNWGQRSHPGWYHNLRANPEGELSVGGDQRRFRAVEATGEQRQRIWDTGLKVYPGWSQYEKRAGARQIVIFVLQPA